MHILGMISHNAHAYVTRCFRIRSIDHPNVNRVLELPASHAMHASSNVLKNILIFLKKGKNYFI